MGALALKNLSQLHGDIVPTIWQDLEIEEIAKTLFDLQYGKTSETVVIDYQKQSPEVFYKKAVIKICCNTHRKHLCYSLFLIKLQTFRPATLLKRNFNTQLYQKETPTQVFSCEYFKIFRNTYFEEHQQKAASGLFSGTSDKSSIKLLKCPANIRLDEDVLKTSFVFIFRRRLQDVFKTS